jgi:uncharacterized protein YhaN
MLGRVLYYGAFLGLSLLLHFLLVQPRPPEPGEKLRVVAEVVREMAEVEQALAQADAAADEITRQVEQASAPPAEPAEEEPAPREAEPPAPEVADNAPVAERAELEQLRQEMAEEREARDRLTRELAAEAARREELERVLVSAREDAAQARRSQQALESQRASDEATRARAAERALAHRLEQLDDWQRYARAAQRETIDADKVPVLRFAGDKTESEFLELMRFYGMEVIVFPPSLRYLAHVDLVSGTIRQVDDPKAFVGRFASRSIEQHGAYWRALADRVAASAGGSGEHLVVQTVIPHRTASYLAWKELEVLRSNGLTPSSVAVCYGSYRRTPGGTWVVDITHVRTFDDRLVKVTPG